MKQLLDTVETLQVSLESMDRMFCEIASAQGYVTFQQASAALEEVEPQRKQGIVTSVGQIMLDRGWLSEDQLQDVLQRQHAGYQKEHPDDPSRRETRRDIAQRGKLGRYQILREVARGGMAVVYEALDPDLNRRVALKVLKEGLVESVLVERLQREAAAVAQLRHPHIVPVHEIGRDDGDGRSPVYFIAMEYIDGGTFAETMPVLSFWERLRVLEVVANTVGYAHQHGIVHRDLKPQNILLEESAEGDAGDLKWHVYLTDFGLAKVSGQDDLTRTGTVLGTAHYMAPEQARGQIRNTGPWTDVWALGVMLYEILTDGKPFKGEMALEVYDKITKEDPVLPSRIKPGVSSELEAVCLKALDKDPTRRYPDAGAFARELKYFRAREPVHARPAGSAQTASRWIQKHPVIGGLLIGTGGMVLLAVVLMIMHGRMAPGESGSFEEAGGGISIGFVGGLLAGSAVMIISALGVAWSQRVREKRQEGQAGPHKKKLTKQEYVQRQASKIIERLKSEENHPHSMEKS